MDWLTSNQLETILFTIFANSIGVKNAPVHCDVNPGPETLHRANGEADVKGGITYAEARRLHGTGQDNRFLGNPAKDFGGFDHGIRPMGHNHELARFGLDAFP